MAVTSPKQPPSPPPLSRHSANESSDNIRQQWCLHDQYGASRRDTYCVSFASCTRFGTDSAGTRLGLQHSAPLVVHTLATRHIQDLHGGALLLTEPLAAARQPTPNRATRPRLHKTRTYHRKCTTGPRPRPVALALEWQHPLQSPQSCAAPTRCPQHWVPKVRTTAPWQKHMTRAHTFSHCGLLGSGLRQPQLAAASCDEDASDGMRTPATRGQLAHCAGRRERTMSRPKTCFSAQDAWYPGTVPAVPSYSCRTPNGKSCGRGR